MDDPLNQMQPVTRLRALEYIRNEFGHRLAGVAGRYNLDPNDFVQECLLALMRRDGAGRVLDETADALAENRSPTIENWVLTFAFNLAKNLVLADPRRRTQMLTEELAATITDRSGAGPDRGRPADRAELEVLLAALSAEHRQVITMVYLQGWSYKLVAERLDVPIGTVRSRLARARAALREAAERRLIDPALGGRQ